MQGTSLATGSRKNEESGPRTPERYPFPVIAVVHGHVLGLDVDIVSAWVVRYAAERWGGAAQYQGVLLSPPLSHMRIEYTRKSI
jgi:enoyl-CoA hydratase/carnithine racemase